MRYAISFMCEAIGADVAYRFHYLRSFEMILVYKGKTLDNCEAHDKIRNVRVEDWTTRVVEYLEAQ